MNYNCKCKNVEMGSHKANIVLNIPDNIYITNMLGCRKRTISIDKCLAKEVEFLWQNGITTSGACCGHGNKDLAYIGVCFSDIPKMKTLGYKVKTRKDEPGREDSFIPKFL